MVTRLRSVLCIVVIAALWLGVIAIRTPFPQTLVQHAMGDHATRRPVANVTKVEAQTNSWGTLTGRIIYDGEPPVPKKIDVWKSKDAACFPRLITDETLLVHPENRGIANVILYLCPETANPIKVHPSYSTNEAAVVTLTAKDGRFNPHVVLLRTSQTLIEIMEDKCAHNFHPNPFNNSPRSFWYQKNFDRAPVTYPLEETLPVRYVCDIHAWMNAWVVVRHSPYMACTDENGRFTIKDLPVGTHTFRIWHERAGYLASIFTAINEVEDRRQLTITVKPGLNELPTAKMPPKHFD